MSSLYDFPELYGTLLAPDLDLVRDAKAWMRRFGRGAVTAIMDPACGPGTYLLPFAKRGVRVAGNDLRPSMIAEAHRVLSGRPAELVVGDMRELEFASGPFDVAFNFHGSVGHLDSDEAVVQHLESVAAHLRSGGLYLLGLTISDGDAREEQPLELFQTAPTPIPSGGTAAVAYESVWRDPVISQELLRVIVLTKDVPGAPPFFVEEYVLQTFGQRRLEGLLRDSGVFRCRAVYEMTADPRPEVGLSWNAGDVTLVLERVGS